MAAAETINPYSSGVAADKQIPLRWYFPEVDPGHRPLGARVLVQVRRVKQKSKGGILLAPDTKSTEVWNTQVGKVILLGPIAFCNRDTGEPWSEGRWAQVGDYIRVPRWGGDRWSVEVPGEEEPALFTIINDHEIMALVTMDPRDVRSYIL